MNKPQLVFDCDTTGCMTSLRSTDLFRLNVSMQNQFNVNLAFIFKELQSYLELSSECYFTTEYTMAGLQPTPSSDCSNKNTSFHGIPEATAKPKEHKVFYSAHLDEVSFSDNEYEVSHSDCVCEVNWFEQASSVEFEDEQLLSLYKKKELNSFSWKTVKFRFRPLVGEGKFFEYKLQVKKHEVGEYFYFAFKTEPGYRKLFAWGTNQPQYHVAMQNSSKISRYLKIDNDNEQLVQLSCNRLVSKTHSAEKLLFHNLSHYELKGWIQYYAFSNSPKEISEQNLVSEFSCRMRRKLKGNENKEFTAYGILTIEALPYVIKTKNPKIIFFDADEVLVQVNLESNTYSATEEEMKFIFSVLHKQYPETKFVVLSNGKGTAGKFEEAGIKLDLKRTFSEVIEKDTPEYCKYKTDKGSKIKLYCEKHNIDVEDPKNEIVLIDDSLFCHQHLKNALPNALVTLIHYLRCPEEKMQDFKYDKQLNGHGHEIRKTHLYYEEVQEIVLIEALADKMRQLATQYNSMQRSERGIIKV